MPTWLLVCMRDIERLKHRPVDNPQGNRQEYNRKNRRRVPNAKITQPANTVDSMMPTFWAVDAQPNTAPRLRFGVAPDRIF